jgi:hypothetical protein
MILEKGTITLEILIGDYNVEYVTCFPLCYSRVTSLRIVK